MKVRNKVVMAAAVAGLWVGVPSAASATHCPPGTTYPESCVHGTEVSRDELRDPVRSAQVDAAEVSSESEGSGSSGRSDELPVTGGDILGLSVIGLGALGTGAFLVRRSRRPA